MSKKERPLGFTYNSFKWTINYIEKGNIDKELFGETFIDDQEIDIYTKKRSEIVIKNTLLHELLHVLLEDLIQAVDTNKNLNDKEESLIRLVTPRLFCLLSANPTLARYIFLGE